MNEPVESVCANVTWPREDYIILKSNSFESPLNMSQSCSEKERHSSDS